MNILHLIKVITAFKPNEFSKLLKERTKEKHDNIEQHPFFVDLLNGELSDLRYLTYLCNLLPIYKHIEKELLFNVKNESLIQSKKIEKDIKLYEQYLKIAAPKPNSISKVWLDHIKSKKKFFKKADLYIRWLADLYGGQMLAKKVRFGNKYKFNSIRKCIKEVRIMIEDGLDNKSLDKFVSEVNLSYDFHNFLISDILRNVK